LLSQQAKPGVSLESKAKAGTSTGDRIPEANTKATDSKKQKKKKKT
jgi:hypothetical protein